MRRNHGTKNRNSVFYNVALLHDLRKRLGLSVRGVANALRMNQHTASKVFKGSGSYKFVRRVADFLNCDWASLHDMNLKTPNEFDRAVLNGNSKAVRSSGPRRVGALRPAPVERGGTYTRVHR